MRKRGHCSDWDECVVSPVTQSIMARLKKRAPELMKAAGLTAEDLKKPSTTRLIGGDQSDALNAAVNRELEKKYKRQIN